MKLLRFNICLVRRRSKLTERVCGWWEKLKKTGAEIMQTHHIKVLWSLWANSTNSWANQLHGGRTGIIKSSPLRWSFPFFPFNSFFIRDPDCLIRTWITFTTHCLHRIHYYIHISRLQFSPSSQLFPQRPVTRLPICLENWKLVWKTHFSRKCFFATF